jgi:hypothetical protein
VCDIGTIDRRRHPHRFSIHGNGNEKNDHHVEQPKDDQRDPGCDDGSLQSPCLIERREKYTPQYDECKQCE